MVALWMSTLVRMRRTFIDIPVGSRTFVCGSSAKAIKLLQWTREHGAPWQDGAIAKLDEWGRLGLVRKLATKT